MRGATGAVGGPREQQHLGDRLLQRYGARLSRVTAPLGGERTFGWLGRSRRLSRDYERKAPVAEAFVYLRRTAIAVCRGAAVWFRMGANRPALPHENRRKPIRAEAYRAKSELPPTGFHPD